MFSFNPAPVTLYSISVTELSAIPEYTREFLSTSGIIISSVGTGVILSSGETFSSIGITSFSFIAISSEGLVESTSSVDGASKAEYSYGWPPDTKKVCPCFLQID
ncbi:MAG: hypothetical protein K0S61_4161 [Anaerocolumna sp.]|jgi:hypothetical protein|nr:hypothetical protein [Anaerocolumna sp.]